MPGYTPIFGLPYPIASDSLGAAVSGIPQDLALQLENTVQALTGVGPAVSYPPSAYGPNFAAGGGGAEPTLAYLVAGMVNLAVFVSTSTAQAPGAHVLTLPVPVRPARIWRGRLTRSDGTDVPVELSTTGQLFLGANANLAAGNILYGTLSFTK